MDETRSEPPKIKVVDRRKFSAEGDPVETAVPTAETTVPAPPPENPTPESAAPTPNSGPATPAPEHRDQPSQLFLELVTMLAGQAELLLVGAEDLPAQPAEAKRMIDYLGVLEEKTAAHVSDDEAKLLS
ncbi:MAG: DUF1844 domain-containing protein, partial [Thermoanaerobaculales bacterium]|nr:DUF1844 domain-containing protein [Thermoanaerobaculales bacterium]